MKIWKLMAHDEQPAKEAFAEHVARGYIAVGWTETGDLAAIRPSSVDDIKPYLYAAYEQKKNLNGPPSLWSFFALMQVGDYVIEVGDGKRLGVFRVKGDYQYLVPHERVVGYAHVRAAELTNIDANALWEACKGQGTAFTEGENPQGTLVALNATPAAEALLAAHAAVAAEDRLPRNETWDAWARSDRCYPDWEAAGRDLHLLFRSELRPPVIRDDSKDGRTTEAPALWIILKAPLPGVHRLSFALKGDGASLSIACRLWVQTDHADVYERFAKATPFCPARLIGQAPEHEFVVKTLGVVHSVPLAPRGQPGVSTVQTLLEEFIGYLLACHDGSLAATSKPTRVEQSVHAAQVAEANLWTRDEAALAEIEQMGLEATEKLALVKVRIQQSDYRERLLDRWGGSCSVSGLKLPKLLVASHILRWSDCTTARDRWSVDNGLLLHPGLDKAFEDGLISFDEQGRIILSKDARRDDVQRALGIQAQSRIRDFRDYPGLSPYLTLHRDRHAVKLDLSKHAVRSAD